MILQDQVALVTGANSGIGLATARKLAGEGARVALVGHDRKKVQRIEAELRESGLDVCSAVADVTDPNAVREACDLTIRHWNRLDIVVANAGINGVWAPIDEITHEEWQRTIDVNLTGSFLTIKYAVPTMRSRGGSIVVVSSINGTRIFSNSGATAYACSKAAQVAMTKMVALELAKHTIRVNAVCPGAIQTPIFDKTEKRNLEQVREPVEFPEGRIPLTGGKPGSAEQVAELILFLTSVKASHITGSVTYIDGGESLLQG